MQRLAARDLIDGEASFEKYATPRRLAVLIKNVRAVAPERQVREKVLPVSVALDKDGQPTAPLAKKLAALGFPDFAVGDLERAPGRQGRSVFPALRGARRNACRRTADRAARNARQAADSEGDDVPASRRHQRAVRAAGAWV